MDAASGERLAGAQILVMPGRLSVRSDGEGDFQWEELAAGTYRLQVTAADHLPRTIEVQIPAEKDQKLEIDLTSASASRVDSVTVQGIVGETDDLREPVAVGRLSLAGNDLTNLDTVLAEDPLRAIHSLPGVAANDDFSAQFSLRGADFSRIGIYLDGVKLHDAIHSLEGTDLSGSASTFNANLVGQLDLYTGAYPEQFADSSAGVLDVRLRDGNPDRYSATLSLNFGTAGISASGPFGPYHRCSWIAGYRKSYLQYLLADLLTDPSLAFGIEDEEGRAACHINQSNVVTLDIINSQTDLDRSAVKDTLGANSLLLVHQHSSLVNVSWIYSPTDHLQFATHVAWMPDRFSAKNPALEPLGQGHYSEGVVSTAAKWMQSPNRSISAGYNLRAIRETGFSETFNTIRAINLYDVYQGSGFLSGGFVVANWSGFKSRLHLTTSGRWDHHSVDGVTAFSPQAGLTYRLFPSLSVQLGYGQYVQFPELSVLGSNLGSHHLLPTRSNQAVAALEQRLPFQTSLRLELYDRRDRDIPFQSSADPRLIANQVIVPQLYPPYANSLGGNARGVEVTLRRFSATRWNGWLAYSYGKAEMHDALSGTFFPSDFDQRHTVNAYTSYRLRPSVDLSAKWTYGSGFPAPGYFRLEGSAYYLSDQRNQVRIGPYQRVDVRVNKRWHGEKWHKSLYFEVSNVTNKVNTRFGSLDGYDPTNGRAYVTIDTLFPVLPTAGFVLER